MALFTVRPETRWPHDRARLMALGAARERDSRTVKQVTIPVHGATRNGAPRRPFLHGAPKRAVVGVQPALGPGTLRAATRGLSSSRQNAVCSPVFLPACDGADRNTSVSVANPGRGRMALLMVQPETWWPHDRAGLLAAATALERDSRTVKQVTIPVHGVHHVTAPPGAPSCSASPDAPRPASSRSPALRCCPVQQRGPCQAAVQAPAHGPTYAATPQRGTGCVTPGLWGVTQPAAPVTTRPCTAFRR